MSVESEAIGIIQDALQNVETISQRMRILIYILRWQSEIADQKANEIENKYKALSIKNTEPQAIEGEIK